MSKRRFYKLLTIVLIIIAIMKFALLFSPSDTVALRNRSESTQALITLSTISETEIPGGMSLRDKLGLLCSFLILYSFCKDLIKQQKYIYFIRVHFKDFRIYFKRFKIKCFHGSKYKGNPFLPV